MNLDSRFEFVRVAVLFEAGLIVVAGIIGWWFEVNPFGKLAWDGPAAVWGTAAAIPLFGLFVLSQRFPVGPLLRIKEFLVDALGPALAVSRWYDLLVVAAMAGISEEILFRGVLHPLTGLWWSNILFGLAHSITPAYALIAGVIGLFLGWFYEQTGNLLAPIITHGLYDFLAFVMLARECRRKLREQPTTANVFTTDDIPPSV